MNSSPGLLMHFSGKPVMKDIAKRSLDIILALTGLVLFSPFFVIIALLVKAGSPGPVFYKGQRVGRYGQYFFQLKFRTMIKDAEHHGSSRTPCNDTRITRTGKILRRYKLDELPQLLNVLKGEMSFVGPRPDVPEYTALYSGSELGIMGLRPGLTDWATLWYRDDGETLGGFPDPDLAYKRYFHHTKVKLQLAYLNNHTMMIDACIILFTIIAIFRKNWLPGMLAKQLAQIGEPAVLARHTGINSHSGINLFVLKEKP